MYIYLPVEVKVRELEGKFLTALIAAERGHHVLIGEKKDTINLAKRGYLPPGIVHDKSLTPGAYKIENFQYLKDHGHLITAQDEEHGLLDESYEKFAERRFSDETMSLASRVYTWGNHDYTALQERFEMHKTKFIKTGSPRVDLWRPDFKEFYSLKKKSEYKPYILISSNFSSLLDKNRFSDRIARLRHAGYFGRDPDMEEYMYENSAYQLRLIYRFVGMIRELATCFPDIKILVRPHPVESVDAWKKLIGISDFDNVIVERKGTINSWLHHSELLIHNGCTTALEAAAGNIPAIAYRPLPSPFEREIPNRLSIQASDYSELKYWVKSILNNCNIIERVGLNDSSKDLLQNRLSSLTGRLASDKVVDDWEKLAEENNLLESDLKSLKNLDLDNYVSTKSKLKRKLALVKNKFFGIEPNLSEEKYRLETGHKFPSLCDDEVKEMVKNFRNVTGRFTDVHIERYGKKSFLIFGKR